MISCIDKQGKSQFIIEPPLNSMYKDWVTLSNIFDWSGITKFIVGQF